MKQESNHNIILIGFMGSGKTSVGERLAGQISYQFLDTDQLIEKKAGTSISEIFQNKGEEYFRNIETEVLLELKQNLKSTVLSTGGGLPLREQNAILLQEIGTVVYLKASKETTLKRLQGDTTRPILKVNNVEERVEALIKTRSPIYEKVAHKIIETDGRSFEEIIKLILMSEDNR